MNSITSFLASHIDIRSILLISGKSFAFSSLLPEICQLTNIEQVTICASDHRKSIPVVDSSYTLANGSLPTILSTEQYQSGNLSNTFSAVVFLDIDSADQLSPLCSAHFTYLVGSVWSGSLDAFTLWEQYRLTASTIYILSKELRYLGDVSSDSREWVYEEVLSWSRNVDSNVELSIIFPVYNVAKYISKCIESVTAWQADYVEYLFVDDGSPDNSADIIRDYASKDPRIKLLQKENGGCASARQFGLDRASGKYIGFIDPDDYVDESMFPKLFRRAMIGSYEISYCGYNELYETTGEIQPVVSDVLGKPFDEGTFQAAEINSLIAFRRIAIWRGIYLKEMLDRSGIRFHTDLRRFDDLPFKVETMASARSVVSIPEFLYFYRMARPGQDVSADDERLFVHFQIFKYLDEFIKKTSNREQLEYLQVVKIHTHKWALTKLKPEFIASYCEKAREDILHNMSLKESLFVALRFTSRYDQLFHLAICRKNLPMLRYLIKHYKP